MELIEGKREQILEIARRHGVIGIRIFGSVARGDAGPASDVDFLVDVGPHPTARGFREDWWLTSRSCLGGVFRWSPSGD